jgi:hypothetical protein
MHLLFCAVQSCVVIALLPPFAELAQALNCWSQLLCSAAASFTKVSPLTEKGRLASPVSRTGVAAIPPSAPVKDCELAWRATRALALATKRRMVVNCILASRFDLSFGFVRKKNVYTNV